MAVKIFTNSNLTANFICPECGKFQQKDVSKFIKHKTKVKLKYKCSCQHGFSVILERRRSKRKKVQLNGSIIKGSTKHPIIIQDISKHGLRIKQIEHIPLKEEERICVEFILDDPNKSNVSREVRIKKIIPPKDIKCEFISYDHHGILGKYFLFYY